MSSEKPIKPYDVAMPRFDKQGKQILPALIVSFDEMLSYLQLDHPVSHAAKGIIDRAVEARRGVI